MKRQLARHMMELAGIEKKNKKRITVNEETGEKASYFAIHWRAYLDPRSEEREALHKKILGDFNREMKKNPRKGPVMTPWPVRHVVGKR